MKGIDIVVRGNVGHMSAFMAQTGNLIVLGDAGDALGDSIYEARLFVRGRVQSLGADCIEKEMREEHVSLLEGLLSQAGISDLKASEFTRYGSARALYHFDVRSGRCVLTEKKSQDIRTTVTDSYPHTTPRKSSRFDDYTLSEIRRAAATGILRYPWRRGKAQGTELR